MARRLPLLLALVATAGALPNSWRETSVSERGRGLAPHGGAATPLEPRRGDVATPRLRWGRGAGTQCAGTPLPRPPLEPRRGDAATPRLKSGSSARSPSARRRWPRKRAEIVETIWGHEASLPDRAAPDAVLPTNVSNLSAVVWSLGQPAPSAPSLNSTVYHLKRNGRRAFLLHHGHSKGPGTEPGSTWWDHYNMSLFLGDLADADVFVLSMPLFGCNQVDGYAESHAVFQEWEQEGNNKQGPGQATRLNSSSTLKHARPRLESTGGAR